MNKQELIEAICKNSGKPTGSVSYDLSLAYDVIFTAIVDAVAQGESVEIPGFGNFYPLEKHLSRITKPYKKVVPAFRPDLNFKNAVREGGEP